MSLIVWLPLNGNIEDLGLISSTWSNTNATVSTDGKIGQCYSFSAMSGQGIYKADGGFMNNYINNHSFTLCAWIKTSVATDTCVMSLSYGMYLYAGIQPVFLLYNTAGSIIAKNTISTADNKWHHIAATYNKNSGEVIVYVDGIAGNPEYYYPTGQTYSSPWANGLFIGRDCNGSNPHNFYQGLMNDVRIYDECLSPKEIHEISKGLVLHFPMNEIDGVIGGRNLIQYSGNFTSTAGWVNNQNVTMSLENGCIKCLMNQNTSTPGIKQISNINFEPGTYTLSVTLDISHMNPSVRMYPLYLQTVGGQVILGWNSPFTIKNIGGFTVYSITFTVSESISCIPPSVLAGNPNINDYFLLKNIKLEQGTKATPWTPAPEDCPSTEFDETIYDVSGYGYYGISITDQTDQTVLYNTTPTANNYYDLVTYTPSPTLVAGAKYRVTICVTPAANVTSYLLYTSAGYFEIGAFPVTGTAKQTITSAVTVDYYENKTPAQGFDYVTFYRIPNDGTVTTNSTIHWCIIEKIGEYPTWSNDTVIGNGSYNFNGYKKIVTSILPTSGLANSYTFSWWAKGNIANDIMWGFSNGNYLNYYAGRFCNTSDGTSNPFKNSGGSTISIPSSTVWHHYCMVGDGSSTKLYLDGSLYGTATTYVPVTGSRIYINGGNSTTNYCFNGLLNDFRIYVTALSAEDIAELYKTRYSVANNGTLFCNSVSDDNDIDYQNLVFNGDLKLVNGTTAKGFSRPYNTTYGGIKGDDRGFGYQLKVPLTPGCTYRYSFDYYITSWNHSSPFYMALIAIDNCEEEISVVQTNLAATACNTTLAAPLNNGDTTVTITNSTSVNNAWNSYADHNYFHFSIFENLAYGYNRATYVGPYITQYSNGVVTLASAWAGGSFAAGTKVSVTRDGGVYIYPAILSSPQNYAGSWRTISGTFNTNDRYSTRYVIPYSLNYNQEVYFRNIRIENISELQLLSSDSYKDIALSDNVKFQENGQLIANHVSESGLDIRYIRDYLDGNTVNSANHWCEIQAFNDANNNCCWGIMPTSSSATFTNPGLITDDSSATYPYASTSSGNQYVQIDLYKIRNIKKLKIWHYWYDNRKYNNKTQVSIDGTNWITVFDSAIEGTYIETSEGHTIDLTDEKFRIFKNGTVKANKVIEC